MDKAITGLFGRQTQKADPCAAPGRIEAKSCGWNTWAMTRVVLKPLRDLPLGWMTLGVVIDVKFTAARS
jgi:hypothetical protein